MNAPTRILLCIALAAGIAACGKKQEEQLPSRPRPPRRPWC